jgi:hypothetical protein
MNQKYLVRPARRINRPVDASLVMSVFGPKRHFAATHHFGRFQSEADIEPDL